MINVDLHLILGKICENCGILWFEFSLIRTGYTVLSLSGKIRARENPCFWYALRKKYEKVQLRENPCFGILYELTSHYYQNVHVPCTWKLILLLYTTTSLIEELCKLILTNTVRLINVQWKVKPLFWYFRQFLLYHYRKVF